MHASQTLVEASCSQLLRLHAHELRQLPVLGTERVGGGSVMPAALAAAALHPQPGSVLGCVSTGAGLQSPSRLSPPRGTLTWQVGLDAPLHLVDSSSFVGCRLGTLLMSWAWRDRSGENRGVEKTAIFNQLCKHCPVGPWAVGQGSYPMQCSSNLTMPEKHGGACSNADLDLGVGLRLCISNELPCDVAAAAGPES